MLLNDSKRDILSLQLDVRKESTLILVSLLDVAFMYGASKKLSFRQLDTHQKSQAIGLGKTKYLFLTFAFDFMMVLVVLMLDSPLHMKVEVKEMCLHFALLL